MQVCWLSCHNWQQYRIEELVKSAALFGIVTAAAVGLLLVPGTLALSGRIGLSFPVAVAFTVNGSIIAALALAMLSVSVARDCGKEPMSRIDRA